MEIHACGFNKLHCKTNFSMNMATQKLRTTSPEEEQMKTLSLYQ